MPRRLIQLASLLLALASLASSAASRTKSKAKSREPVIAAAALVGEIVPASAPAAILLDGADAASGLVALLSSAGRYAPSLQPRLISQDLSRALGVDPFSPGIDAGLAGSGPRAIILDPRALAFTAPVGDEALAKHALQVWLSQLGPVRPTRQSPGPLHGPLVSGGGDQVRAGMIAPVAGSMRLITASGRNAAALVSQLAHVGRKKQDNTPLGMDETLSAALSAVPGPLRLWSRGQAPVLGALVSLDANANGLSAHGLLLAIAGSAALLDGTAPPESACDGTPLFCARAAPGPALRTLAPLLIRELVARDLFGRQRDPIDRLLQGALSLTQGPVLLRVDSLSARALTTPEKLLGALTSSLSSGASAEPLAMPSPLPAQWAALPAPQIGAMLAPATQLCLQSQTGLLWLSSPCAPAPPHLLETGGAREITARLDSAALARSLSPLTALDALRGPLAAGAFAGKLLWGALFANSGPIDLAARPTTQTDAALAGALDLSFAWPLSSAGAQQ